MSIIKKLKVKYDGFTLDIPLWEIKDQGVTALWGPSGVGKSTVFRTLLGLEVVSSLEWIFELNTDSGKSSVDLAQLPIPDRRLGVVFQNFELFPHMTAQENILFAARARKISSEESLEDLEQLATHLKITPILSKLVGVLSGGEQQRVALARALIGRPIFLMLDEPFSALDQGLKGEARNLVKKVIEKYRIPTLLITHDEEDVRALASYKVELVKEGGVSRLVET